MKYSEVQLIYTCPARMPDGVYLDRIYHIVKKNGKLYFTDGNAEFEGDINYIKMLFSPKDKDIEWQDIDFSDEEKVLKKFK